MKASKRASPRAILLAPTTSPDRWPACETAVASMPGEKIGQARVGDGGARTSTCWVRTRDIVYFVASNRLSARIVRRLGNGSFAVQEQNAILKH